MNGSSISTIFVTGATGFIGQPLCAALRQRGYNVKAAVRSTTRARLLDKRVVPLMIADIESGPSDVWREALEGTDVLIHLAARVHRRTQADASSFWRINTHGTSRLCRLAVDCGVRRIIYLSTIKVNGETSPRPFREVDPPHAQGPYALSKLRAEERIKAITNGTGCRYTIIRPPLVYGPRVKANFLSLLNIVALNVPLPFGNLHNRRSMIYVGNLVDAIICVLEGAQAADQIFLVSDGHDRSVAEVVAAVAKAMGNHPRLFPFPKRLLWCLVTLLGQRPRIDRLTQPLTLDIAKSKTVLGWRPPFSVVEGIADTVDWFRRSRPHGS